MVKKIIIGFILGAAILLAFIYAGGSRYLKAVGVKTEEAGEQIEKYERKVRESADEAGKAVGETAESAKKAVEKTVDSTKKGVERVKEMVER